MRNFFLAMILSAGTLAAQTTATDFTATDCSDVSHTLFQELDAGKAVVIVWVMPCAPCIKGALEAQAEVQSALASFPGKVLFFLADDYANTSCGTLSTWCATNGITDASVFSSKKIKMSDYGSDGMPKVVVLGGPAHTVFYNAKAPDITQEGIRNGISAAIAAGSPATAFSAPDLRSVRQLKLYPNPARYSAVLDLEISRGTDLSVVIVNSAGETVREVFGGRLEPGIHAISFNTGSLQAGLFFVVVSDKSSERRLRLLVER